MHHIPYGLKERYLSANGLTLCSPRNVYHYQWCTPTNFRV